jgi:energy-coupling factor transporter ATP-binding protein EcfA2
MEGDIVRKAVDMSNAAVVGDATPLLRTLSPALRGLERGLRAWLDSPRRYPLSTLQRAALEGLAIDLHRQSEALDVDRPLLVVMLMGGTGVGKSTLLNALAGGAIAQASFARPTTRDPVVYYHESIKPDRLDPALRHCRLAPHDRPALKEKILVDTPDLDSNDLSNRDKLMQLLPVADIVLYVGSQEKYHDKLGWELFLNQRKRRAFAFVLNKWDRCLHPGASGIRPDEDLLRDLQTEGFREPLLFRTCAQMWVDRSSPSPPTPLSRNGGEGPHNLPSPPMEGRGGEGGTALFPELPEGEQFQELVHWLEMGLTRLEIEAIKARGVGQLLQQLHEALDAASPPDLTAIAERTRAAWSAPLSEEAAATSEVLLETLEPYQREIEHHFTLDEQRRFHGLMAWYLHMFTRAKYVGSTLRDRIPFVPRAASSVETPATWDLARFTKACSDVAGNRHLDARGKALANKLLVEADTQSFPLDILAEPIEARSTLDWRQRYAGTLNEVLQQVEREWSKPTGLRRLTQAVVVWLGNWLPPVALLAALIVLLWRYFYDRADIRLPDVFVPAAILLVVLVVLHLLISLLLPLRWPAIRGEFRRRLEERIRQELQSIYEPIPGDVAQALRDERRAVEKLAADTAEVASWLRQREQSASISGLYGH